MQRNQQYASLLSAAYAFFCEDFATRDQADVLRLCFEEAYRYASSSLRHPIEVTHTTSHSIPFEWVWDGIFITDEKYLLGHYELTYTDGTVATLPVRYGSHIGCAAPGKTVGNNDFLGLVFGVLPIADGNRYAYRTAYEDPHPDKVLAGVRYLPAEGREAIAVELLGARRGLDPTIVAAVTSSADTEYGADIVGLQE